MAPPNLEKLRMDELARLGFVLDKVNRKLESAEGPEARPLSERLVQSMQKELEETIEAFESASFEYINSLPEEDEEKAGLKTTHFEQIDNCDPALDKLYELVKTMEAAKRAPSQPPEQNTTAAKFEVNLLVTSLQNRLTQLEGLSKDDATRGSIPALKAALKEVADLETAISSSLSQAAKVLSSSTLPQAEQRPLAEQIDTAADVLPGAIIPLKLIFNQLLAQLAPPPPISQATPAGSDNMSADIVAGITAGLRPLTERMEASPTPSSKSATDFGYAKTPVPTFDGNIRNFTKWKIQVQDHLESWRKSTSEKSAILKLDRLTPTKCDVSNCATLKEAWDKLTAKFGSATNIARVLLEDFKAYTPKGRTDEAKLVDLRDTLEKLQADLITNKQVGRCEDFSIIDTAEAMIPGSYRRDYVKEKGDLTEEKGSAFGALFTFLQEQGTLIEEHMPDKLDHFKETKGGKHSEEKSYEEKIKMLEAKVYAMETKSGSRESPKPEEKAEVKEQLKKSEEKTGKCPLCSEFHYFTSKSKKREKLASDRLSGCEKFKGMTLAEREEVIIKRKACAKCLSWKHERNACTAKTYDCKESNCGRPHHSLLHGTTNVKILTMKKVMQLGQSQEQSGALSLPSDEGMLEMCHYIFRKVNIGTTILFDCGATTCLISAKLARYLGLRGKLRWVSILRAGDKEPEVSLRYHHTATLTTNEGVQHKIQFLEVDHISDLGPLPLPDKLYELFPHVPAGALERPIHDVGILIGQNAAALLPIGGDGKNLVGNLRLLKIPFGKGFTVGGCHPEVKMDPSSTKANLYRRSIINHISSSSLERAFPDIAEIPLQLPRTCSKCVGCKQCRYEVQEISLKEQKELQMLRAAVRLDPEAQVCVASYPELDPGLPYSDNRWQAVAMASSLEKQLQKSSLVDKYNLEWEGLIDRDTIRKVTKEEIEAWKREGKKVNYISHHAVLTPEKATTKVRLVANSSLKNGGNGPSPNENWPKGPNALKPLYEVFLRFRVYEVALHYDLAKMFHSVKTGLPELFMRLMTWRNGDKQADWEDYGWLAVAMGDRPASCIMELAKSDVADAGVDIDPVAARAIKEDTYVDDGASGGSEEAVSRMIGDVQELPDGSLTYTGTLSQIFSKAGFRVKMIVRSGETNSRALEKMGGAVLGHQWEPRSDTFSFHPRIFLGKKGKSGTHTGPELTPSNLTLNESFPWTKALVLSTVASLFDPSGIVAPAVVKLRLFMREVCMLEKVKWSDPLPEPLMLKWRKLVEELVLSEAVVVSRGVRPPGAVGKPFLAVFTDGSLVAFGAVIYIIYRIATPSPGPWASDLDTRVTFSASLFLAKGRVAPLAGLTAPRSEMNSLICGAKLLDLALRSLPEKPEQVTICLDSECTIAAVDSENGILKSYLANRRATYLGALKDWKESYPETGFEDLQHVAGVLNPADLLTRGACQMSDLGINSDWQKGPAFLCSPRESWPVSRDFCSSLPEDEVNKAFQPCSTGKIQFLGCLQAVLEGKKMKCDCRVCSLLLSKPPPQYQSLLQVLTRTNRILKARGVMARILRTSAMLAKRPGGFASYTKEEVLSHLRLPLTSDDYTKADRIMLLLTQPQTRSMLDSAPTGKKKAKNSSKGARTVPVEYLGRDIPGTLRTTNLSSLSPFQEEGIWYTKGRFGKQLKRVIGTGKLAIISPTSELANLIMLAAHAETHMGGADTCARSRPQGWIVRARPMADRVAADCTLCRKRLACPLSQRLGFLPEERTQVFSPPFKATALDFLGPYWVKGWPNPRSRLKVWPVVMGCLNTGALHLELAHNYGTDALLTALESFTGIRGYPDTLYSDRGSQLQKAAAYTASKENPENWDWNQVEESLAANKTTIKFCHPGCQWQNGLAEQRVKGVKEGLELIMTQGSESLNYAEFRALLIRCANRLNDRPVGVKKGEGELLPLTPNQLLIGKTSSGATSMEVLDEGPDKFTKRAKFVAELERLWWNIWMTQCFDSMLPFRSWTQRQQNLVIGDIVAVAHRPKLGKASYRLARVYEVDKDEDGLVRTVHLEARPPGGKPGLPYTAKQLQRFPMAVQRLVLIHPVEQEIYTDQQIADLSETAAEPDDHEKAEF